jgi:hypothetical protein
VRDRLHVHPSRFLLHVPDEHADRPANESAVQLTDRAAHFEADVSPFVAAVRAAINAAVEPAVDVPYFSAVGSAVVPADWSALSATYRATHIPADWPANRPAF